METPPTIYKLIEEGSNKGHTKLGDSEGWSYCRKKTNKKTTWWSCSVRKCKASVKQQGDDFIRTAQPHTGHEPKLQIIKMMEIIRDVKKSAAENIFKPAAQIVSQALRENLPEAPTTAFSGPGNLARAANRHRAAFTPDDPKTLDFELDESAIPDEFLRKDIHVNGRRHLIFATEDQLKLLSRSKNWYGDGTFKIVKSPFYQMWSIHAFIQFGQDVKQVPLVFVLMSGKRREDYEAILEAPENS